MIRPERGLLKLLAKLGIKSAQQRLRMMSILRMQEITRMDLNDIRSDET